MEKENFTKVIRFLRTTKKEIKYRKRHYGTPCWTNRNKEHLRWSNFKEIENWAKKKNYETFRRDNRLFLLIGMEIFVYFKEKKK